MSLQSVRMLPASEITLWASYFKIKNTPKEDKPKSDIESFKHLVKG